MGDFRVGSCHDARFLFFFGNWHSKLGVPQFSRGFFHVSIQPVFLLRISGTILLLLLAVNVSSGAVTFFGSVNPDPPGDGDVEAPLVVGTSDDDNPDFAAMCVSTVATRLSTTR